MCKKFQFDHTNKWDMHNPAPVLENHTHKLLRNFNIQTDQLIPARRPDLIIINDCTNCNWCFWHNNKRIIKRPGGLGSWRTGRDYSNDSITENGHNTKKSPEDLRRLAVTQTPVKNH